DGRVGGKIALDFGGGMVSSSEITQWEPPYRFVAEDRTWLQGGPPVATEWIVEARAGGTCVVRVVHSLFADTADWDDQLESTENGWPGFFRVLRHYLTHHRGQRSAKMQVMVPASGTVDEIWATLARAFGIESAQPGQRVLARAGDAPPLEGVVEHVDRVPQGTGVHARLSAPAPGVLLLSAMACSGMQMAMLQAYFYGDGAEAAARDQAAWQAWLGQHFPAPTTDHAQA